MRQVSRKPESVEIFVSYWVKAYKTITKNMPMESGLTRRAGRYIDLLVDHGCGSRVVGAVNILRIFEPGMGPYVPLVRRNCPPLVVEPLSSSI